MAFAHPEYLVDTAWLAAHLDDPGVVVLDATTHLIPEPGAGYTAKPGRADFEQGHIPGAQFVDLQADLSEPGHEFRFMLPSAQRFAASMARLGVGDATRVILYSTANVWWASRVWWLLRVFGHDNAAVLDGGFQKWSAEQRPVETGAGTPRTPAHFTARALRPLMADKNEVLAAINSGSICTINALRPEQHTGTGGVHYGRPGRIAGSVNVAATNLLDPATNEFLPAEELRAKFEAVGAMDRSVITYCGGGIAASADALVLTMLGHKDVKLYDASLSEWVKDPSLPMEAG
ncbi:MAG: sulfurtransferase [Alphaproteobacteria bacterium]|nr:sulfurtransferase [Alphaproteobacteria bacterium]